ncbi:glutathione S-transferase family protein [Tolypothrix sp. PCC 7910]|uniref:glutathione S-transferase family protein n=1 Tax=Tolypothrix sp. PCC 7910 TaxID=2099387 RepID=UPI0014279FAF|nr:glutathione S-transferase family protein [Tolypothrix sp. PCC 7910]QIR36530.1 glutathione S-transferase family protein [Tolypothrix sp. PCC 7910]
MASGIMVAGKWTTDESKQNQSVELHDIPTTFRDRVTADGASGFKTEAGRYHLYVSLACPWAHRTLIMRELKGLNDVISVAIADMVMSDQGWMFSQISGASSDSVNHARYLQEIYLKANPKYTGRITVPALWDQKNQTIVNNESREIMRMFDVEFASLATKKIDLYPRELQQQIDETIDAIYLPINVGVYRAGFAREQTAYEEAIAELFENLERWEAILSKQRYLCGNQLTEADICMFATLYRFDSVYYGLFKCNWRRIIDYPNLWNYLKDLYQRPEFKATCNLGFTKSSYYMSMTDINPNRIVPSGPIINFEEYHDRDRFAQM